LTVGLWIALCHFIASVAFILWLVGCANILQPTPIYDRIFSVLEWPLGMWWQQLPTMAQIALFITGNAVVWAAVIVGGWHAGWAVWQQMTRHSRLTSLRSASA
jgi:hypothetical protein